MRENKSDNLRRKAEQLLTRDKLRIEKLDRAELTKLAYELGVHQIELEIQNEELRCSRLEVETARDRYANLYDFAPVSYFTLNQQNFITEVNLNGASLLGLVRSRLIGKRFTKYVTPDINNAFYFWRKKVLKTENKDSCELGMTKEDGTQFFAYLEGMHDVNKKLRIALIDISERKITEEKRLEAETRYHSLFDEARDGIVIVDAETGDIIECNPEFERQTGKPQDQLIKKKIWDINPYHLVKHDRELFLKTKQTGEHNAELIFEKPDGTNRFVELRAKKIRYKGNDYFQYICRDITHNKEIEQGLEKSNQKMTTILGSISDGFFILEDDLTITSFNDAAIRLLGVKDRKILSHNFLAAFPEFKGSIFEENFRTALKTNKAVTFETYFRVKPFENWYNVKIYPNDNAIAVFFRITTESKGVEAREAYLASFPQFDPNPVIEISLGGEILYLNPATKRLLPYFNIGQHIKDHHFFSLMEGKIKSFVGGEKETRIFEVEVDNRWYHQTVQSIDKRIRIYSFDITDRKKAEIIKDDFIGMVSHELKTPMSVIIGALSTLNLEGISQNDAHELIEDAVMNAGAMTNMIENLLELSRNQSQRLILEIKPTDIYGIVQNVVKKLKDKSKIHKIIVDMPSDIPLIHSDSIRLERVIYNLTNNAIKYSPNGGEVKILAQRQDDEIIFGIKDHGIGISHEDKNKIFHNFQRVGTYDKQSIPGIGLGLRVCQILVDALGGRIWIESEPGEGATFFFTLPLTKSPAKSISV